jgi:hypothetical protein
LLADIIAVLLSMDKEKENIKRKKMEKIIDIFFMIHL